MRPAPTFVTQTMSADVSTCEAHTELGERPLRGYEAIHHAHHSRGGEEHEQGPSEDIKHQ